MAPTYNLNYATGPHPYMTCIVKVDTRYNWPWNNWQKTIARLLNKCHGIFSFRVVNNGTVEISGTINPSVLLITLGRAGRKAELVSFQFGQCSSNLFMPPNYQSGYNYDGRYLHADNITRSDIPSHESISRSHKHNHAYYDHHGHDHNSNHSYDNGYDHHGHDHKNNHDYGHIQYGHHGHDHKNNHDYSHHGYDHKNIYGEDMPKCCIINHGHDHNNNHNYGHREHGHKNNHGYGHHGYNHKNIYGEDMPKCCIIM